MNAGRANPPEPTGFDSAARLFRASRRARRAWAVRYVDRTGKKAVHHSVYLGDDERLVELVRLQLDHYRVLGRLPDEMAVYSRIGGGPG
jgi:hypothetical protein